MTRAETAAYCATHGLTWREDSVERDVPRAAASAQLLALHPAAEQNVLATLAMLRDEAAVLDDVVDAVLREGVRQRVDDDGLAHPPAEARAAAARAAKARRGAAWTSPACRPRSRGSSLQRLADEAGGPSSAATRRRHARARPRGTATLDLPGGLRAVSEYGRIRIDRGEPPPPAPAGCRCPAAPTFGAGEITCERGAFAIADGTLAAHALAPTLEVRAWRPGDRMRPLGLRRHEVPAGPVHRPQGPARAPRPASRRDLGRRDRVGARRRDRGALQGPGHDRDQVRLAWRLDSAAP